jgi:hypothetical protein
MINFTSIRQCLDLRLETLDVALVRLLAFLEFGHAGLEVRGLCSASGLSLRDIVELKFLLVEEGICMSLGGPEEKGSQVSSFSLLRSEKIEHRGLPKLLSMCEARLRGSRSPSRTAKG